MFPITCNAVGDIIAVVQLVRDIVKALNETRGAAAKYRSFVYELESLGAMMEAAYKIAKTCESGTLQHLVLAEVQTCCLHISSAYERISGFEDLAHSTSMSGSTPTDGSLRLRRHRARKMVKQLWWHFARASEVGEFAALFHQSLQKLGLAVALLSYCRLNTQIPASVWLNSEHVVVLTDALGERIPVALQLCDSLERFHEFLEYFYCSRERKGQDLVQQGLYELYDGKTSQLITSRNWSSFMRPGGEIEMGIILRQITQSHVSSYKCPYCGGTTARLISGHEEYTCKRCHREFRATTERESDISDNDCVESVGDTYTEFMRSTDKFNAYAGIPTRDDIASAEHTGPAHDHGESQSMKEFVLIHVIAMEVIKSSSSGFKKSYSHWEPTWQYDKLSDSDRQFLLDMRAELQATHELFIRNVEEHKLLKLSALPRFLKALPPALGLAVDESLTSLAVGALTFLFSLHD